MEFVNAIQQLTFDCLSEFFKKATWIHQDLELITVEVKGATLLSFSKKCSSKETSYSELIKGKTNLIQFTSSTVFLREEIHMDIHNFISNIIPALQSSTANLQRVFSISPALTMPLTYLVTLISFSDPFLSRMLPLSFLPEKDFLDKLFFTVTKQSYLLLLKKLFLILRIFNSGMVVRYEVIPTSTHRSFILCFWTHCLAFLQLLF